MTVQEHLLACLAEECAEISHRVGKALRFGIDDKDPTNPGALTERALIKQETVDLIAVIQLLVEEKILPDGWDVAACEAKKQKVRKFMDYARERGALISANGTGGTS